MRISLVWLDANQPSAIWDSGPNREIKTLWFRAAVESLLIYGAYIMRSLDQRTRKELQGNVP